ncbi:MAG: hypothetical protein HZC11_04425 [Nitrospirae bacterium]|nr:hypothetical protein [Nitrospirota bacterium]
MMIAVKSTSKEVVVDGNIYQIHNHSVIGGRTVILRLDRSIQILFR